MNLPPPADRVAIRGTLQSWSGYGRILEHLGRGLESLGIPVAFEPGDGGAPGDPRYAPFVRDRLSPDPNPGGWVLLGHTPDAAPPREPSGRSIRPYVHLTMWESSDPPTPNALPLARALVVPCRFNAERFRASLEAQGRRVPPMFVIPPGLDPTEGFAPDAGPALDGPTTIGMAGRYSGGGYRKGFASGAAAFLDAFSDLPADEVRLSVNVFDDDAPDLPCDPRIEVVRRPFRDGADAIPPAALAAWYRSLTALLVPSKGEGWGMHTHEAMACARPVIAAPWSGTADLVTPDCGWMLPYRLEPARGRVYDGCGDWCVPSHAGMVAALRAVHADRREARRRGVAAARRAGSFTWTDAARRLCDALREAGMVR